MCFVTFHITLGGFEGLPLPAFVAYLMVWSGIRQVMSDAEPLHPETSPEPNTFFRAAAAVALINALIAVPRVLPVRFNLFLSSHPLISILNLGLITLGELALAYLLLTGGALLLNQQGQAPRMTFYLRRLRRYLILYSGVSVFGVGAMALGQRGALTALSVAMLFLRIWFLTLLHGLKPAKAPDHSTEATAEVKTVE